VIDARHLDRFRAPASACPGRPPAIA
jgi:hypothetical protein